MNIYKVIDERTWKRATHCEVFRNCIEPSFCLTFDLDVTKFYREIKKNGLSFTFALVYIVTECANQIEEFRYRFLDGKIVLFDKIDTAFTY
ncbi:TPA: chloramphenicol acetyltransferase, partial [Candidatus Scatousia excrementigallinarum]|nr:chloramphenicol acetyltransferase [Candidatus Scatousia excrementigallinarum]